MVEFRDESNSKLLSKITSYFSTYSSTGDIIPNFITSSKAKYNEAAYYKPGTMDIVISYDSNGKIDDHLLDFYNYKNVINHEMNHWKDANLYGVKTDNYRHAEIVIAQIATSSFIKTTKDFKLGIVNYFGKLITNSIRTENHTSSKTNGLLRIMDKYMKYIDPSFKSELINDNKTFKFSLFGNVYKSNCTECY